MESKLDQILAKHNGELGVTWEDPDVVTPDTKAALLSWNNQQLEKAVIEARQSMFDEIVGSPLCRMKTGSLRGGVDTFEIPKQELRRIAQISKSKDK